MSELKDAIAAMLHRKLTDITAEAQAMGFGVSWDSDAGFRVEHDGRSVANLPALALPVPAVAPRAVDGLIGVHAADVKQVPCERCNIYARKPGCKLCLTCINCLAAAPAASDVEDGEDDA